MLKEAIRSLGRYTEKQCTVFDALADIAVNNITHFSINIMSQKTKVTRPTIYNTLKAFQRDGILDKNDKVGGTYLFQQDTLDLILALHKKQLEHNFAN